MLIIRRGGLRYALDLTAYLFDPTAYLPVNRVCGDGEVGEAEAAQRANEAGLEALKDVGERVERCSKEAVRHNGEGHKEGAE